MITLQQFMETVSFKITEGDTYGWTCFGSNAFQLSSWNGLHDDGGYSLNVVFDTRNQTVYTVEVCDYTNSRAYRLINPAFVEAYRKDANARGEHADQAWDDVDYVDLETDDDWLEKADAIINQRHYDTRIIVPVDIPDDELFQLFKAAHKADLTLNQYLENILRKAIELRDEIDDSTEE